MSRNLIIGLLCALIVAHLALAGTYATLTPYRQAGALLGLGKPTKVPDIGAPDERQHVNYVIHLLEGKGFPVFNPQDPNLGETYQSHQPPLYYLLAAGWSRVVGASDLTTRDSGIKLRFLNVTIGGATVAGVFFLAFWGFRRPDVALGAAGVAAFLPMFSALAGAVSNDPLLICLCTWILALSVKSLRDGWTWKAVLLIGGLTGLAMLTKTTAISVVPILLVAVFLSFRASKSNDVPVVETGAPVTRSPSGAMIAAAAVLALVLAGPWWVRNQKLYHDPLAIGAFNEAFKMSAQKSSMVTMIQAIDPEANPEATYWKDYIGWWTARSFFGVFGYMDIWLNERGTVFTGVDRKGNAPNTLYRLLLAGTAICFLGWVLSFGKPEWAGTQGVQILNSIFFGIVLILFLRFNMQYFQAQARYLLPALGPIACGFSIGLHQLLSKRAVFAAPALAVVLIGVNFYAISILPDAFAQRIEAASRMP